MCQGLCYCCCSLVSQLVATDFETDNCGITAQGRAELFGLGPGDVLVVEDEVGGHAAVVAVAIVVVAVVFQGHHTPWTAAG
jgi:hypothetical protein